jgi:hypothetical protein
MSSTGHADKGPGEVGLAGRGAFIGEDAGVEDLRQPLPVAVHALDPVGEAQPLEVHLHAQMHRLAGGIGSAV